MPQYYSQCHPAATSEVVKTLLCTGKRRYIKYSAFVFLPLLHLPGCVLVHVSVSRRTQKLWMSFMTFFGGVGGVKVDFVSVMIGSRCRYRNFKVDFFYQCRIEQFYEFSWLISQEIVNKLLQKFLREAVSQ